MNSTDRAKLSSSIEMSVFRASNVSFNTASKKIQAYITFASGKSKYYENMEIKLVEPNT